MRMLTVKDLLQEARRQTDPDRYFDKANGYKVAFAGSALLWIWRRPHKSIHLPATAGRTQGGIRKLKT